MVGGYEIGWVGHNFEDNHDKIWGWLQLKNDHRIYCFWGRRGKKLRFKLHHGISSVRQLQYQKEIKKGYCRVKSEDYNRLVKDFLDEVEIWCMAAILTEEVM